MTIKDLLDLVLFLIPLGYLNLEGYKMSLITLRLEATAR
jgi:hypothetical protein